MLREEMLSQFRTLGEAVSLLRDDVLGMRPQIAKIDKLDADVEILKAAARSHTDAIRANADAIHALQVDVTTLKSDVSEIKLDEVKWRSVVYGDNSPTRTSDAGAIPPPDCITRN